jgi:hypothetical protein
MELDLVSKLGELHLIKDSIADEWCKPFWSNFRSKILNQSFWLENLMILECEKSFWTDKEKSLWIQIIILFM